MEMTPEATHEPVLVEEIVRLLAAEPARAGLRAVDATVGLGGHAAALLAALPPDARLLGIDRDPDALEIARRRLERFGPRVILVHARFSDLGRILVDSGLGAADLVLADLGASSLQLDQAGRGFSFRATAALDMRMDPTTGETAAELLGRSSESEIARLLAEFGEEPAARRIARALAAAEPPATTEELRALVARVVGARVGRRDPATLTFQALRIAVNHELEELDALLEAVPRLLAPGARLAILAYHSLEDRRVKEAFRGWTARCVCPPALPVCRCGGVPRALRLTRGAHQSSAAEVERNPRSRSARLRALEWIGAR
jgi:16S rRNA (cytosine1402-N4)-methyltransferase